MHVWKVKGIQLSKTIYNDRMKRYLLIFLLLIFGATMQSQVLISLLLGDKLNTGAIEFGLEGGINWTQISGMETKNFARKWNLGFYFDIRMKNQWFIYTGVLVKANQGVDNLTDNDLDKLQASVYLNDTGGRIPGAYGQKMNSFFVPVLVKYKFKNNLFVMAGPQFALSYQSFVQFDSQVEGNDALVKEYNKEKVNNIDAGVMVGIGYTLWKGAGLSFGAKYYEGFVHVYKGSNTRNRGFYLYATMPIGASEKAKEKALAKSKAKAEKKARKQAAKEKKENE